jgi:hypothetical protein
LILFPWVETFMWIHYLRCIEHFADGETSASNYFAAFRVPGISSLAIEMFVIGHLDQGLRLL